MLNTNQVLDFSRLRLRDPYQEDHYRAFDVWGEESASLLTCSLVDCVLNQGFRLDPEAPTKLLIDLPGGTALRTLKMLDSQDRTRTRLVVVTFSLCPEYYEDLWDMQPDVLLVDPRSDHDIASAIERAACGGQYRTILKRTTSLNYKQRRILCLLAQGWSNGDIGEQLEVNEKTVLNSLTRIYAKLGIKSRTEAIMYYWGILVVGIQGSAIPRK